MPDQHASDASAGPHGSPDDHGETHGHDDHARTAMGLGRIDVSAWGAALVGILLGLVVAGALAIGSGYLHA
jgi:hypothetical protein